MRATADLLLLLSVAALGVFAGAMLTEGGVLVPYWRSLSPADFFAWYGANDRRLLGFFGPLTAVAALLAIAAALGSLAAGRPGRWLAVVAALLMVGATATFFLYFERANASFSTASIPPAELPAELTRWARWHWARMAMAVAALAAGLGALRSATR